ncbi:MAG: hypothetical protein PSV13_16670 [Lacunisphaera sp.]|nr:hypothetical protein [Lacunisphaera sp.]
MSLINDALKKAQKQRTGEAPPLAGMPSIGGESPGRIAKRAKPASFNALFLRVGLGAGALLIVVGVGAYYALRSPGKETAPPAAQAHSPAPVVKPPVEPPVVLTKASEPAPTFNLPIAAPPAVVEQPAPTVHQPAPEPVATTTPPPVVKPKDEPRRSGVGSVAKPAVPAPAAEPSVPVLAAKMDGKAVGYIENLRIAGIRASATDSKVLMNDRVYRVGDIVEHELGLKLIGITSSSMTFEDERGARYTRNF